jgi:hypothetical protein
MFAAEDNIVFIEANFRVKEKTISELFFTSLISVYQTFYIYISCYGKYAIIIKWITVNLS